MEEGKNNREGGIGSNHRGQGVFFTEDTEFLLLIIGRSIFYGNK
jgi:hypothetical protein